MNAIRSIYHVARADFLERVRRYSFLVVLGAALMACYYVHTGNIAINVEGYRGTLNSAWLGAIMTLTATVLLGLAGFYLVNNCLARDEQTGVGQILAATPVSRFQYILGKALSNFAVLWLIVLILILAAVPLQWLAGEDRNIRLWPLIMPFLLFAVPLVAFVSALAIFFETVSWLRGAIGNGLYFILFVVLLTLGFTKVIPDFTGIVFFDPSMHRAVAIVPSLQKGAFGFNLGPEVRPRGFDWQGLDWTPDMLPGRLFWLGITVGLCVLATLFFDRFDKSRFAPWKTLARVPAPPTEAPEPTLPPIAAVRSLPPVRSSFSFPRLFFCELRLLLKAMPWWWYAGLLGGIVAGFTMEASQFPRALWFVWIWPLGVWSRMGSREAHYGTGELVFSAPNPLARQLPATWLAGFAVALIAAAGVLLRMSATADWTGVEKGIAGAAFIASLALALGTASGSGKLFEASYTGIWYIGVLNHTPGLDYTQLSVPGNNTAAWLGVAGCALLIAAAFRWARLRR